MKRVLSLLMAFVLLIGMVGCAQSPSQSPAPQEEYTPIQPLTYTALPTALAAQQVGQIQREVTFSGGGLYYKEGDLFGIMTFDGQRDSGPIYTLCQPKGDYFLVAKNETTVTDDVTSGNAVGMVDAAGRVIIPLQYASVEVLGQRFARVAELTGITENADESLTKVTLEDKTVLCTGNWYIYDLQTGEKMEGATGTKPYISFDCGGYVKYVLDDKTVITSTPAGKPIPNDVIHLKNGHYAVPSENAVYDSDGNKKFTYDPNGYIPEDSANVNGYIVAKKTVSGKDTYVLLDLEGKVATAELKNRPNVYGDLLYAGGELLFFDGKPAVKGQFKGLFWEPVYGQCWTVFDGKTYKAVDKSGKPVYKNAAADAKMDTTQMVSYQQKESKRTYYSVKENGYKIEGVALSPFVVKRPVGESRYELVNVLTGEVILSGALDYKAAVDGSVVYVYAMNAENSFDVYAVR